MILGEVAHVRSGDKGDILNLSLIPVDPNDWGWLAETVTPKKVGDLYAPLLAGEVRRYELPGIPAFNFVITGTLGGGVSRTLGIDPHGKSWGSLLLELDLGPRPEGRPPDRGATADHGAALEPSGTPERGG
jgi:hypothetical protein